ncbi:ICE-like protease (caspase) p20 domain protein [Ceratobasidium sp. AG-Ba]|nr:ICE-like protease (caspase) p20 domain protein [Ceratobasidium sp. AG-Ba]QRW08554.1 ICE-like protease (caspase) p20 domain protein [Ceratobasidium sp. AG-Ba]
MTLNDWPAGGSPQIAGPQIKSHLGSNLHHRIHVLAVALTYKDFAPDDEPLIGPVEDVRYLEDFLSDYEYVYFQTLFESDATRDNIIRHFQAGLTQCQPTTLFVIYLAGHGENTPQHGYSFTTYYERSEERQNAMLNFQDLLQGIRTDVQIFQIRDTCDSSPNPRERYLLENKHVIVLSASGTNQPAYEASAASPHSFLLRRMERAVRSSGFNTSTDIRVSVAQFFNILMDPIEHVNDESPFVQNPQLLPERSLSKVTY